MNVLVGVSGGIAAYKAAELVRALQRRGVSVQVAMTASAEEFVRPLTFAALTGKPVFTSVWRPSPDASNEVNSFEIEHIAVAQKIDALVIAPATANLIAKLAHGLADDFLTTLYLATKALVLIAPAMNVNMLEHPATRANLLVLNERGVQIVAPDAGYLACGMVGGGRLAEPEVIAEAVVRRLVAKTDLAGEQVLITAGGTREAVDPVRFMGNRSSGKMGHALAEEAVARGATVTLVTASNLPAAGCKVIRINTAEEMLGAVLEVLPGATLVIGAAAVADFRPVSASMTKIRRVGPMTLELEATPDILVEVGKRKRAGTMVVAFAAETEDVDMVGVARAKMRRKGADAIVLNDVSAAGRGFDSDRNAGFFLTNDGTVVLEESSKRVMASRILDQVLKLRENCVLERGISSR